MSKLYPLQAIINFFKMQKMNNYEEIDWILAIDEDDDISFHQRRASISKILRECGLLDITESQKKTNRPKFNDTSSENISHRKAVFPCQYLEVKMLNAVVGYKICLN